MDARVQKRPCEDTEEGGYLQANKRGLRRNQSYKHTDLTLPASNIHFHSLSHTVYGIFLWQPPNTLLETA